MARLPSETVDIKAGRQIEIRPIRSSDAPRLVEALGELSRESSYRRFLSPKTEFSRAEVRYLTDIDHREHEALVAVRPEDGRGIAVARFVKDPADGRSAEVAITVADDWQNRGVGHALLRRLAQRASEEGVNTFLPRSWSPMTA